MKALAGLLSLIFLSSCSLIMSDEEATQYYREQSTMRLCMSYLTNPTNHWTGFRLRELESRGENCSEYAGAAQAQAQSISAERKIEVNVYSQPGFIYDVPKGKGGWQQP